MATKTWSIHPARNAFLLLLLVCSVAVTIVAAAGPGNMSIAIAPEPDLNVTNYSFSDTELTEDIVITPTPVTIIRAELTAETLPGPRYMAFGPSTIDLSIDPRLLAVCFAIVIAGIVVWFVIRRKRGGNNRETAEEPEEKKKD
ncbi:MAG: hypothetical protein M0R30_12695 [Methanoregula sp.]|jgi:hypothetical protein|uniref:hypothetical protein n=1 Tax=Methanoregula sp. TaxID=2052170 RepID=UPI0025FA1520|nr:hypothetical protein [Methanoregula sp.]MCK9632482.1 hypothetical protein [Methanoregula sp.]